MINTPTGSGARADGYEIRRAAVGRGIPCITTMSGASAAQRAISASRSGETAVVRCRSCTALPARALRPGGGSEAPSARRSRPSRARSRRPSGGSRAHRGRAARRLSPDPSARPAGPRPPPGPVLHAEPPPSGGAAGRRAALPAARVLLARARAARAARAVPARGRRAGTARLAELRARRGSRLVGPLGLGFGPRPRRHPAAARRRRHRRRALLCLGGRAGPGGDGPARLSLRRPRRGGGAVRGRPALATDDGSAGRQALVTDLLREELDADPAATVFACGPPRDARGRQRRSARSSGCRPSSRSSPAWRAASAPASAASSRRATATCGCASTAPSSTPTGSRPAFPGAGH